MMYSQSDQTGILDVIETKKIFLKILWILHFHGGITVSFLRKVKVI